MAMSTSAGFQLNVVDEAFDQWQEETRRLYSYTSHFEQLL